VTSSGRPELAALQIADPPELWTALGFSVAGARTNLGGIEIRLGVPGTGIVGWSVGGVRAGDIDGLHTSTATHPQSTAVSHPNGAIGLDHVVIVTPEFDRTAAALDEAGMPLRRIRDAGNFRQGFRRLGPAILELVEASGGDTPPGPARFWGLVIIVSDLDALSARLGDRVGDVKRAVQPGRRIATLREHAGLGARVAFMDPEPLTSDKK
jgi:hypothetical protein